METTCGHPAVSDGLGTGYALFEDGGVLCYSCSDDRQRADLEALEPGQTFVAYMSNDKHHLTSWSGGVLLKVTQVWESRISPTCQGLRFWAVSEHGARFYGTTPGAGMYALVHRAKA